MYKLKREILRSSSYISLILNSFDKYFEQQIALMKCSKCTINSLVFSHILLKSNEDFRHL